MACLQEVKLNTLTNDHKIVIKNYGLENYFQPAMNRSGGLITMWNQKEESNLIATSETCLVTEFPKQSLVLVNTYIRTNDYKQASEQLSATTAQLRISSKIVLLEDVNAYKDRMKHRIGSKKGPVENHMKIFKKLQPTIDILKLTDLALTVNYNNVEPTHFCKNTGSRTRLDFIFTNNFFKACKLEVHPINMSVHGIVEANIEMEFEIDVGPGIWRLNNNILFSNYDFIKDFFTSQTTSIHNHDAVKQKLTDRLRNICLNKSILSKQYRHHLENELNSEHEDKNVIMHLMEAEDQKQTKELLGTMKHGLNKVNEGESKDVKNWISQSNSNVVLEELKTDERILTTTNEITNEFYQFWKKGYTFENVDNLKRFRLLRFFRKNITEEEADELARPITIFDIEQNICKLKNNTSPGPDVLTAELYRCHRPTFARILLPTFQEAFNGKQLPKSFSHQ